MQQSNIRISLKIGLLVFFGLFIVLAGGFYIYRSLVQVVDSLASDVPRQGGVSTIKELTISIDLAENDIRLYGITNQSRYLKNYRQRLDIIDSNLQTLNLHYPNDDWFVAKINAIDSLVGEKEKLWGQLINIWQQGASPNDISLITQELKKNSRVAGLPADTIIIPKVQYKLADEELTVRVDTVKKGFFARLFTRNKDTESTSGEVVHPPEKAVVKTDEMPDSVFIPEIPDQSTVIAKLENLEESKRKFEQHLSYQEVLLADAGNNLSESFMALISELEAHEEQKRIQHYKSAEKMAHEAYQLLSILTVSGMVLGLLVVWVVIQYIRKNRAYNKMLIESRKKTEELALQKELFMANVSHEIRTPLNAITGFVKQLLLQPIAPEVKSKLTIVDSAGDQLLRLMNDVLDFSKMQSSKLTLNKTHFNPVQLVTAICDLFSELAAENGNTIQLTMVNPDEFMLYGDAQRFQQIIYNLLSNAVKFTEDGTIDLHVEIHSDDEQQLQLKLMVTDSGLGIEADKLEYIFQEYTQANADTSAKYGGTGLGLSIVKKLVELFQGKVEIESTVDKGTRVICNLQFEKGDAQKMIEKSQQVIESKIPSSTRILIADDEAYNRSLIAMMLDKWHVSYDVVKNGQECIDLLSTRVYDFVLMDLRMPVVDGLMATKYIRENLRASKTDLPVIGVTADVTRQHSSEYSTLFNAFLQKPFTEDELHQVLTGGEIKNEPITVSSDMVEKDDKPLADISNLVHLAGNDKKFISEMIHQFKASTLEGLAEIRREIARGNHHAIGEMAHRLCPPGRHLGVEKLVVLLKKIEHEAHARQLSQIEELAAKAGQITTEAYNYLMKQYDEIANV